MTLILTESDMLKLFEGMTEEEVVAGATEWVRKAFIEQASRDLRMHPRVHVDYPEGEGYEHGCDIRIMPSIVPGLGDGRLPVLPGPSRRTGAGRVSEDGRSGFPGRD